MTSSRLSSIIRAGVSFLAALFLILPGLAAVALAQSGDKSESAKPKSDYLNEGVYRLFIRKYFYLSRPTDLYTATGFLVREPNLILTTRLWDKDGLDLYDNLDLNGTALTVCEQEPDPVRLAAQMRDLEKGNASAEDMARFQAVETKAAEEKKKAPPKDEDIRKIIQKRAADIAEKGSCVSATVKKIDAARDFVLIEAKEKLVGKVPIFNVSDPEPGTTVRVFGFPKAADYQTRRSTTAERDRMWYVPTVTTGTVVKTTTDAKEGQIILHQAPISDGAWGSPLMNLCGEVIGLNQKRKEDVVVKAEGSSRSTGSRSGEVRVEKIAIPTSNVVNAAGAKELVTFASLNNFDFPNVNRSICTATPAFSFQQNMWTVLVGGSALLLAATSLVIALRRPAVRNTMIKMFPGMGRSTATATAPASYGGSYGGGGGHRPASDYASNATTAAAYAPRPAPAAPTNLMPTRAYASPDSGAARLVPIGGGQPVALDAGRLDSGGVTFGRESTCDIVSDNSTVSKRHARITRTSSGKLQIEDLSSANGTWRGRNRIQREVFGTGDVVRFGSLEYRIELSANGSGPTQLMPAVAWMLSGSDEKGPVHWHLQPTTDSAGRQMETNWIVGRNGGRADQVLTDKRVSAEHAKIRYTPQRGLEICDLGSSNGTRVDGRKITDSFVPIDDARAIDFGGCVMSISKK